MAEEILEGVSPTRMELLRLKGKRRLAEKGHRLLKERRDALVMEFMNLSKTANEAVEEAASQLTLAKKYYNYASSMVGQKSLESASLAASDRDITVEVGLRSVVGVKVPTITTPELERSPLERGLGLLTNPLVDKAALEHEKLLESLLRLTETESSMRSLAAETKKTKRRVNALEYNVIPKLKHTQKYIGMRLDEIGREDFYRLKMFKSKRGG